MMRSLSAFLLGVLFAVGLVVSGMTDPDKVLAFLDVTGAWDGSLMLVMGGAIGVYLPIWLAIRRRPAPVLDDRFHWPTHKDVDARLVLGAVLFGIGWGVAGYCPGPAFVSLGAGYPKAFVICVGLLGGFALYALVDRAAALRDLAERSLRFDHG
jgi:uncharacterized membrane protein YedE/YeeE